MPDAPLTAARGPWTGGYTSAVPPFLAKPDQLVGNTDGTDTNASRDCVIDPFSGAVSRRLGTTILNDTVSAGVTVTGILNGGITNPRCRKMFAIDSPSLSTGYPTLCALYGEDDNDGTPAFPASDSGFKATIWLNSHNSDATTNALKNYSLLEEFGMGDTYGVPATEATAADYRIRVVPIWYESGDGVYNRGALTGTAGTDRFMQQLLACGSRSLLQTQDHIFAPNLRAMPWKWNKRFNESATIGGAADSEVLRISPTGPLPPLFPPAVTVGTASANDSSWTAGDTFFISVIFQLKDGSFSAPFIPRAINDDLTSGLGLVTVGTIASGLKYKYLTYSKIPLGPTEDCVARILLRTTKQLRTAVTDTVTVSPLDLRIIGVLRNNTQTSYVDYGGDDTSLLEDVDVVRVDHTMPRRARFIGTGDQRAIIGYTLPNTAAILLAPTGINGNYDRNAADTHNDCYGSTASLVRITSTQLELHYNPGAAPDFVVPGNARAFLFSTYTTLERLVDAINGLTYPDGTTGTTDLARQWSAQLAPGIDGTMPSASLTLTSFAVADATTSGSNVNLTSAAAGFGPVGIGMKVSGTNITAGTYVSSKTSNSALTLSTAATGVAGVGLTFYQETGDNTIVTGGTLGYIRSFSSTLPLLLHMKPSAMPGYDVPDKTSIYFTVSSPGAASSGISLAPNAWVAGNRRLPHASPRQMHARSCVGIVDIEGAAIVAFSDGIHMFANQRGANSGEDFDYRLFTVNDTRGCISYLGLVAGNGWAAWASPEGIIITDKNRREFTISSDVYNPSDGTGDLAYEIGLSAASVAADSDNQCFSMAVMGSRLVVGVRASSDRNSRFLSYDFSPGIEASGVEEMLNPETKRSYIWSPPTIYNNIDSANNLTSHGAMGSIRNASGRKDYVSFTEASGGAAKGRIETLGQSLGDNGNIDFASDAVVAPFVASEFMSLSPQRIEVIHKALSAVLGSALLAFANDQDPTFDTVTLVRTLQRDGIAPHGSGTKGHFIKQLIPIDQGQRGMTDMFWVLWRSTATTASTVVDRVYRMVLQYNELENG